MSTHLVLVGVQGFEAVQQHARLAAGVLGAVGVVRLAHVRLDALPCSLAEGACGVAREVREEHEAHPVCLTRVCRGRPACVPPPRHVHSSRLRLLGASCRSSRAHSNIWRSRVRLCSAKAGTAISNSAGPGCPSSVSKLGRTLPGLPVRKNSASQTQAESVAAASFCHNRLKRNSGVSGQFPFANIVVGMALGDDRKPATPCSWSTDSACCGVVRAASASLATLSCSSPYTGA